MVEAPSFRSFIFSTLVLILTGWGGVVALVLYTEPVIWNRWALFALFFLALTGTSLPIIFFFHKLYPSEPPAGSRVIVRQAQWIGVYGLVMLWLRWGDLLTLWLALGLAVGFLAIESLIRLRERSLWKPPLESDQTPAESEEPTLAHDEQPS